MSALEGSIGSSSGSSAAPPPSSTPAAAPPSVAPQPTAAPVTPATPVVAPAAAGPAVTPPAAAAPSVTPVTPGAQPSDQPTSLDEVKEKYRQEKVRLAGIAGTEGAQPQPATPPVEAQPQPVSEPAVAEPPPVEAQPAEPVAPTAPVADLAAPEFVAPESDTDYLENPLTTVEALEKQFPRVSKKVLAEVAKLETHRAELIQQRNAIGGEIGARIASVINPILLGKENPTEEDVDTIADQFVLPENAHALKLWELMGKRLINLQLQDPETGRPFASNMISEEYGKNDDGTDFDFWGMDPMAFTDLLMRAAKYRDAEGEGIINREFIETELAANKKPEPSAKEKQLQAKVEELESKSKTDKESGEAEAKRKDEQAKVVYKTQATGFISRRLNDVILPLATKANWAATAGEEGPQVEQKTAWGRMVTNDISTHVLGPVNQPTAEYQEVLDMIENGTAFDATGHPIQRFLLKLEPIERKTKARFREIERLMGSQFKFAAQTSRAAQLVKQSGQEQPGAAAPPPSLATPVPAQTAGQKKTTEELLAEKVAKYRTVRDAAQAQTQPGVF